MICLIFLLRMLTFSTNQTKDLGNELDLAVGASEKLLLQLCGRSESLDFLIAAPLRLFLYYPPPFTQNPIHILNCVTHTQSWSQVKVECALRIFNCFHQARRRCRSFILFFSVCAFCGFRIWCVTHKTFKIFGFFFYFLFVAVGNVSWKL